MHILFFIHCLIGGGAERVTVNLSNELIRRGYKVTIVLNRKIIDYVLDPKINIDILPSPILKNGILSKFWGEVKNKYLDYKNTKKILKKYQPNLIIASWGSRTLPILLTRGRIPAIASEHNTFDRKHNFCERIYRFFLNRFFDRVVVLTEYDKEFTKKYLNNTIVIPNPLTYTPISYNEYEDTFLKRKNILACGRINAYHIKGFDTLIIAFSKIASINNKWDLDIAGAGTEENINLLRRIAKDHGVENRVHFLGFCPNINEIMKKHSIFVLSSRSEGFGMVITEAMAMGCACISYALTGPSEIIINNVDGILVENQNIEKMSIELSNLLNNSEQRKTIGRNAIQNVKRFSSNVITDKWESLFHELTSK